MSEATDRRNRALDVPDPRWKDLYRIGFLSSLLLIAAIALAILIYAIWGYSPGGISVADVFAILQRDLFAGLMSLEISVIILLPIMILHMLALYGALKQVNESFALVALVLGITGIALWLTARPVVEMVYLSDQYATAITETAKAQYLAAGEAIHAQFNGTAWLLSQCLIAFSGAISSVLMLHHPGFGQATAYLGLGLAVFGFGFWIPGIGVVLSLLGTVGGVAWYALMARDFFRLGWGYLGASSNESLRDHGPRKPSR